MADQAGHSYVYRKRGIFYFSRRIPLDLAEQYQTMGINLSLRTRSLRVAKMRASVYAVQLTDDWTTLRWRNRNNPFSRFLNDGISVAVSQSSAPLFSEAKTIYLKAKQQGRSKIFLMSVGRAEKYLTQLHGNKPIDCCT